VVVLLANPGGSFNLGDALLQEVLVEVLTPHGPLLVHRDPQRTETVVARFFESAAAHLGLLRIAARVGLRREANASVVVPPGESLKKSLSSLPKVLAQLGYFWLLSRSGIRVVVLARSSYFESRVNTVQERALSALSSSYSLRDRSSVERARARGVVGAVWCPDLSWLSSRPELQGGSVERRPALVLCFRAEKQQRATDALLERIGELLAQAGEIGLREVVLVQHGRADAEMARSILERFGATYRISRIERPLGTGDIGPIYGKATLVLTNLLHSMLVSFQCGASCLAVVPDHPEHKVRAQLADIQLLASAVDLHTPVEQHRVAEVIARARETRAAVDSYREKARRTAGPLMERLFAA
jgi:hypothetical protein